MSSTSGSPTVGGQDQPEDLALSEIIKRYKGRWVGIVVTGRDKNMQPTKGKVVADDIDRYMLRPKLRAYKDICIYFAGEPPYPLLL
ncbi:MAG: hypothetical protein ABSG45_07930 [Nitrososphaerales archaeon]|jgi:hypothetical protein